MSQPAAAGFAGTIVEKGRGRFSKRLTGFSISIITLKNSHGTQIWRVGR